MSDDFSEGQQGRVRRAIVVGSSGGIGAAVANALEARGIVVSRVSRGKGAGSQLIETPIDLAREETIASAAESLRAQAPYSLIFVATGLLHDHQLKPEKSLRELDQATLMKSFAVNSIGPAIVAKHFVPLLPKKGRCMYAALSARVGSISDNRLGGWYGYRASKAALNMLVKTMSIELARTHPDAICVALHPGTVDTNLSRPFQRSVRNYQVCRPADAADHLLSVMDRLTTAETGRCFAWDGSEILP